MTANVAVVTETRAHVLELSSSAITTNGTVSTVQLVPNGKTTVTRIQTGLVGDSSTEIVSGVSARRSRRDPDGHRRRCDAERARDRRGRAPGPRSSAAAAASAAEGSGGADEPAFAKPAPSTR